MKVSVHCATAVELLNSLESNTEITLDGIDYNIGSVFLDYDQNIFFREAGYIGNGRELVVRKINNCILSGVPGKTRILTSHVYADVLIFEKCSGIQMNSIILGHFPEYGGCTGGVLRLADCDNIILNDVTFMGCGVEGIIADDCDGITVNKSTITKCSYQLMLLDNVQNMHLCECSFVENETETIVILHSNNVIFNKCVGKGNKRSQYHDKSYAVTIRASSGSVRFDSCDFQLSPGTTLLA